MAENKDKIFCGSAKKIEFPSGGYKYRLSLQRKDVETILDHIDGTGWVNLELCSKRKKVDGKSTHYLAVDTWKPDAGYEQKVEKEESGFKSPTAGDMPGDDELPF